jgi:hypothetical protein
MTQAIRLALEYVGAMYDPCAFFRSQVRTSRNSQLMAITVLPKRL